ncbi:MAG: hypothetical protein WCK02_04625 [Bacteroidota bacterium]
MKTKKIILSTLFVIFFFIVSCNNDDEATPTPTPNPTPSVSNIIEVTENIDAPTTWLDGKIYIIKKNDFYVNNTLTIEPGVIVKFHPSGAFMTLGGTGTINADGTDAKHIIFTSYKDDEHGGDNNGDGTATSPARKDWGRIGTNGLNSSLFNYCEFLYGGSGSNSNTLEIYSSTATVTNCTFAHNDGSDGSMNFGALDASNAEAGTVIQNNIFYDNIRPLSISTLFSLDDSNIFHNPSNTSQANTYNGIYVESINHIDSEISWSETEVAYIIDDNDLWINSTFHLTLADNVTLKFTPSSVIVCADGSSNIQNYNGTNVYFTSYKDDAKKGDTNGDNSSTNPANSDWGGIYDDNGSVYFTWSNIIYDSY